jgi:hypothetical protein
MAYIFRYFIFLLVSVLMWSSCSKKVTPGTTAAPEKQKQAVVASPPCIIYRTKENFNKNIPVGLSEDKSAIISYPDIKDIYYKGELAYPTELKDGFYLDNRGIGPNVAFTEFTYESYARLDKTPSSDELFGRIISNDPLTDMYQCGTRSQYADPAKELNDIITSGKLDKCKKLK